METVFFLEKTILINDDSDTSGAFRYEIYKTEFEGLVLAIAYSEKTVMAEGSEVTFWAKAGETTLTNGRDICGAIEACKAHYRQNYKK
ncbi:hypothetical protein ACE2DQ_000426 [Salmonella enterica]|uniref:Uncharacterized protein n=3 Tax=Salmonella enterica TaxID=28901 RepID=A0A5T8RLM2_SALER|nr:hypothetical protein [Salmonella enterica]EAA0584439.1 hypothetical protein [Salmonella enterica subsp. enterica serovar Newport]EBB5076586.1 hypothetical protein [Salmonella enterica subsp. enterica serovar Typhimurium]EBS3976343.1 hypothetical protein [Salmonella enterica subsp. enterica serovar Woodinville]EBV1274751.1 hypothetical protein [Salmonella enterica subsp. enterica serovar Oranienburg]ECB7304316.1 hypothetical protein [Salmonella enterica subsp. enterica serovar Yovokome]ECI2